MTSILSNGSLFLHILGLASFTSSFQYLFSRPTKISQGFGGHFQFLTNIGLLLSFLSFTLSIIDDILPTSTLDRLKRTTRFIAMPLEATITLSYWPLYFANKSLIVDHRALPLPFHRDIGFHLLPALFLLADYYVVPPKTAMRVRPKVAGIAFVGFLGLYGIWLEMCYERNGFWPYPILGKIGTEIRVVLFVTAAAMMGVTSFSVHVIVA